MFVSDARLPHLLKPADYTTREAYDREVSSLLRDSWHVVATRTELAKPGCFITADIAGVPIQVRNFDGQLKALSNVCAHRHCLLTSQTSGSSPKMRCQYHGWEYQADGCTGRIPEPKNFAPLEKGQFRLQNYSVETIGQLVFVSVAEQPRSIREQLGEEFVDLLQQRFGEQWRVRLKWNPEYPANWKVPIENSLEAYHVPAVHPQTFRVDPGEQRSEHVLLPNRTAFGTSLPFSPHSRIDATFQRLESTITRWLGYDSQGTYWQHHVFPNLLFSFTDCISLCHCIVPTGVDRCRAVVRQFSRVPVRGRGWLSGLAAVWGVLEAKLTQHILKEDLAMFAAIQQGLQGSQQAGALGRCEERIHAFQSYYQQRVS